MGLKRRRCDRPDPARRRLGSDLERLEGRELLSATPSGYSFYTPSDLPPRTISHASPPISINHPIGTGARQLSFLDNDGKVITGRDRAGNEYAITVHGPGVAIVTDATPNDGVLDDDIATIQLVGTSPTKTYVTGQVTGSALVQTNGVTRFNRLINQEGVASIILNGFTLAQTVPPPSGELNNAQTGIFLDGGVGVLQFHDIEAPINPATDDGPINIIIGGGQEPRIRLDSIFNTVIDPNTSTIPSTPLTTPTVNIIVNGNIRSLDMISSTQEPIPADEQFFTPVVGTTGRTAIRAKGIDRLKVLGNATNVTASRGAVPFRNGSGLTHIGRADFGGNADGVGLDVKGRIGKLRFARGLGSPVGTSQSATTLGTPTSEFGYPAAGLLGGLVTAGEIGEVTVAPADVNLQTASNPGLIQLRRQGNITYYTRPGVALSSSAIVSAGSINKLHVVGDARNSEVKTGFDYPSFAAGLEGTRAPSQIRRVDYRGDLVDSVVSATYRPFDRNYGTSRDVVGPGTIRGRYEGDVVRTGTLTALGNRGAGFFAQRKSRDLPPPEGTRRHASVLFR